MFQLQDNLIKIIVEWPLMAKVLFNLIYFYYFQVY